MHFTDDPSKIPKKITKPTEVPTKHNDGNKSDAVKKRLRKFAEGGSKALPEKINEVTTLIKFESSGLTLTLLFVLDAVIVRKIDRDNLRKRLMRQIPNVLCNEKENRVFLENGVTYSYNYQDKNGLLIFVLNFNIDNCKAWWRK